MTKLRSANCIKYLWGQYAEVKTELASLLQFLDERSSLTTELEYMGFKLRYMQVKLSRKIREMNKADDVAASMVDFVTEKLPSSA